jgi:LacI family transcriptional regulator
MKTATIADVAERAGVSKATVSAVLNNKEVVKESTRRQVLRVMEELNYRPSPSARRGFRGPPGRSISVLVKEAQNPFYAEVFGGVQRVAEERGYLVSLTSSEGRYETEQRLVQMATEQEVAGVIIAPLLNEQNDLSHIFELKRNNVPFVLLEAVRGIRADVVEVDNIKASSRAVGYLIELGHSRIVHFAGPEYSQHSQERIEGVRRAFSTSQLVFDESMVVTAGHSMEEGYRLGLEFFRGQTESTRPTAVTCYNDLLAIGLLRALRELGIAVPEQVSLVGFDDLQLLEYLNPPLSSVRVPTDRMGRAAAEMLIRQIETGTDQEVERLFLDAELVLRCSTAPPAAE